MNKLTLLFILFLTTWSSVAFAQMEGLWVVTKITMGEHEVTPSAKWFHFHENGRLSSGNGWIQHTVGSWQYDNAYLSLTNENGYNEPADPFQVSQQDEETMLWQRQEDGQSLSIFLSRSRELPASHIDKMLGLWDFSRAEKEGRDISAEFDSEDKMTLWIRWDRKFNYQHHPQGMSFGHWFIDAHKQEIEFLAADHPQQIWSFEVGADTLVLKAGSGEQLHFKRITEFPAE